MSSNIDDGPNPVSKYYQCDICHFEYSSLKGMRIHKSKCSKQVWWREKMFKMMSLDKNQVVTCDEIAQDYANSLKHSKYPTIPSYTSNTMTSTSSYNHQTSTRENIQMNQ